MELTTEETIMSEFSGGNSQINLEDQELRKGPSVELMQKDLWTELHRIGNEMIITNRGNLIAPRLTVRISNLHPTKLYKVMIDCEPKDDFDYKFNGLNWRIRSESGRKNHGSFYTHPSSPALGEVWMGDTITFPDLRLTNNVRNKGEQIVLNTMRRYQPRIHILEHTDFMDSSQLNTWDYTFEETEFIAVSAYKNKQIRTKKQMRSVPQHTSSQLGIAGSVPWAWDQGKVTANHHTTGCNHTDNPVTHNSQQRQMYPDQGNGNRVLETTRHPYNLMQEMSGLFDRLITMNMYRQFHHVAANNHEHTNYNRTPDTMAMGYDCATHADYVNPLLNNTANNEPGSDTHSPRQDDDHTLLTNTFM